MGTALTPLQIGSSYSGLLKTTDNAVINGTLRTITDGMGNDSALQLSTGAVNVNGALTQVSNGITNVLSNDGVAGRVGTAQNYPFDLVWNNTKRARVDQYGIDVTGYLSTTTYLKLPSLLVAMLETASVAGAGAISAVSDANATTRLSTVAGGGSNKVLVMSNGTNWLII